MTNEEIIENGRRLFKSAENLRQSSPDLDALMESLWEIAKEKDFFGEIEDLGDEDVGWSVGWLANAHAYNAAVFSYPESVPGQRGRRKNPTKIGTLTFILRLCNSGELEDHTAKWPWLDQACLILGWHPKDNSNEQWWIDNFTPDEESQAAIHHFGHGLWAWRGDGRNYAYFFVLPIFAFRTEEDLKKIALRPLKKLFHSDDPVRAAEEVLSDVPALQLA